MRWVGLLIVACSPTTRQIVEYRVGGLHITGAPPIDPGLAAAIRPYDDAVGSRLLAFDTQHGVLANHGGDLVHVRAPGEAGTALTRDLDVAWAAFAPSGIVYAADRDGDEQARLYAQDGRELVPGHARVVDPIVDADGLVWSETDGVWAMPGPREVHHEPGTWTVLQRAGDYALARRNVSVRSSALYRIDLKRGGAIAMTPVAPDVAAPAGAFGARGELYAICNAGGVRARLFEVTARGRFELAPELAWDVSELAVAPDGATVAFTTNEDGASVLHLYDPATREHRVAPGAPSGGVIEDLRFARDAPILAFTFGDARRPREVYTYDVRDARLAAWTRSALPGREPVAPTHERVASFDGTPIAMLVYRPRRPHAPVPVIVELHGGPEDQFRPRWAPFEQLLVARGYAVVQPNVRGSTGYGTAFAALDDGSRREDVVRDVGAVLDWIATRPELDARDVSVLGTSYGGYLALASLIAYAARLRAGVVISGIADFVSFLEHTAGYRADERRVEYGDERDPDTRVQLARMSPLARAAAIRAPLVVAHGARDPRVPVGDADRLVTAVRAAGGRAWYVRADDEGHGFARLANRDVLQALVIQLLASVPIERAR